MQNLISDLSVLTTISENSLDKLVDKSKFIICHDIQESLANKEDTTDINIGIGSIKIKVDDEGIKYRFVPSKTLEKAIMATVEEGKSPLTCEIEQALVDRIERVYKELF